MIGSIEDLVDFDTLTIILNNSDKTTDMLLSMGEVKIDTEVRDYVKMENIKFKIGRIYDLTSSVFDDVSTAFGKVYRTRSPKDVCLEYVG